MRLHNLPISEGANRSRKRIGRGRGSGHGKTAGRGMNGQNSRSGGGVRVGFEGGQMPLYRKLPKRGFNNKKFTTDYDVVNVGALAKIEDTEIINRVALIKAGLIRRNAKLIKILGTGETQKALKVEADKFSSSAQKKIEAAGGQTITPNPPVKSQTSDKRAKNDRSDSD